MNSNRAYINAGHTMSTIDQESIDGLPLQLVRQIDETARRAEREWRMSTQTRIEDYLLGFPIAGHAVLLEELLLLEVERLREHGERPSKEDWLSRFQSYPGIVQRVLDANEAELDARSNLSAQTQRLPKIPGYTIERQIGRGAMGVVYLARHERLQRLVALKVVVAEIELRQAMSIIRAEAEIIARLRHPCIVQVYDVGEDHGEPFLSLEFVDGESLRERMLREQIPLRQAVELVEQMAIAMQHAHVHGVVHRDLKPANILLPRAPIRPTTGRPAAMVPKISDFGLAKVLDAMHEQTQPGSLLGTPKYMSPEQAEGRSREVGPATDVYSLGAILYEMLTGQTVFGSESSVKLLQRITNEQATFPPEIARKLPLDLQAICLKCLEKSLLRRYASAQELADDLRRFLDNFPVLARRSSQFDVLRKFVRRNRVLAFSVTITLMALLASSIGMGFFAFREADARRRAEVLATKESDARVQVEKLRKKETHDVYWANLQLARQAYKIGHLDHMQQLLLDAIPEQASDQDLRGFEWHYLSRLSKPNTTILEASQHEGRIEFSPDGRWLAVPSALGKIAIWDTSSWKLEMELTGHTDIVWDVAFSPDGEKLASGARDGTLRLWDLTSGSELHLLKDHGKAVRSVAFSPDGRLLVSADTQETVILWNVEDVNQAWTYSRPELFVMDVAWSPDNRRLALGCGRGTVVILGADDGMELQRFYADHQLWLTGVAFSPNGERLATCGGDATAKIWDLADNTPPMVLTGHSDWLTGVTFNGDGSSLATSSRDGTITIWDAQSGSDQVTLKGHSNWVMSVAYSADGKQIASNSMDGTVRVWNPSVDWEFRNLSTKPPHIVPALAVADQGRKLIVGQADGGVSIVDVKSGQALNQFQAHSSYLSAIALSPDGQSFVTASHDRTVKLWNLGTCQEGLVIEGHKADVIDVAFSPTERRLATVERDVMVHIWDLDTGAERHGIKSPSAAIISVSYSPNGKLLATGTYQETQIWDTTSWEQVRVLQGHSRAVHFVTFSHDGSRIATGGADQTIRIWETSSGQQLQVLKGHSNIVTCLAFSRDGKRILSCGHDGTVRLWETESGRELLTLSHHTDWVNEVAFSPDEDYLVSGSNDRSVKLIELKRP